MAAEDEPQQHEENAQNNKLSDNDIEDGELSTDSLSQSPDDLQNNHQTTNSLVANHTNARNTNNDDEEEDDLDDLSMFNMTDKQILDKIPKSDLKWLKSLNETQREKEILKIIENFEAKERRNELMKRVTSQDNTTSYNQLSENLRKSSKWETKDDVEDLMTLHDPISIVKSNRSAKNEISNWNSTCRSKIASIKNLESVDSHSDDEFFKELDQPKFISTKEELNKMRLSRSKILKALYMPYFKKLLIGSYVKANMGTSELNGYQVCKILDISETNVPYKVENTTTRTTLKVVVGKKETMVRIVYISNSPFDTDDFENMKIMLKKHDINLPTKQQMKYKFRQIESCKHYHLTDTEVTNMVNEKQKYQSKPTNLAIKKTDIIKRIELAKINDNKEDLRKWTNELEIIEEKCNQAISIKNSQVAGLLNVNKRNRKENLKFKFDNSPNRSQNSKQNDESNSPDNPFKRMKSRPNFFVKKNKIKDQAHTAQEVDENQNEVNLPLDSLNKNGRNSTASITDKNTPVNEFESLHDFDVNIDIIDF